MKTYLSKRASGAKRSAIRELLKLTEKPDVISFAGGLPAPETFPHDEFAEIAADELHGHYENVLQYGLTEGSLTLRRALADWLRPHGLDLCVDQMLITTASQQALDLVSKAFLDTGDVVFVEAPTYLAALQTFTLFEADKIPIPLEDDGMDLNVLEEKISEARAAGKTLKAIYVIPDFQNPSGITMSLEKRKRLLEIARKEDLLIFEDEPYGQLRFAGKSLPSIRSLDDSGRVILMITFSKVLAAGLRLGVLIADNPFMDVLVRVKQATDLCTSKLTQHIAARYINEYGMEEHLKAIREVYHVKRDAMVSALEEYMPKDEGISWTNPEGGLFLWVRLPEVIDTEEMFPRALENKVAYVIGNAFYVDGRGRNEMRLSFSLGTPERIREGIRRLAKVISEELVAKRAQTVSS
ncbi:MAG TPA: PLP-dependent aminotransferase family protein [Candidatus Acetothermia bacterium]|nr:PLP-dependent aminotransferase family protein [Candidatus Acetothermia bacterium]HEX32587.1 PLP-dependent aminotransferase family protein [Candidatus Acetothermia bacterium]